MITQGAVDCDLHPSPRDIRAILPYMDEFWREQVILRGIDRSALNLASYPLNAPTSCRPDFRPSASPPGSDFDMLKTQALDGFGLRYGICNTLHGALALRSEDMAAAFCRALNDWMTKEWLDRDPRLRASILIPFEGSDLAVEEIARCAKDPRFVSVLMLAMPEMPVGRRNYWPIYAAAQEHGLTVSIHAGSTFRQPPTSIGWPSTLIEDNLAQSAAFENALLSLIAEGVFSRFPKLKVAFLEAGFMWLPSFMWRAGKTWRGVRPEVPWVDRPPAEFVREHVRLSIQPYDAPPDADDLRVVLEQIGSDELLLFSTDYPHWQFDGLEALPKAFPRDLARKILVENPLQAFPRLENAPSFSRERGKARC